MPLPRPARPARPRRRIPVPARPLSQQSRRASPLIAEDGGDWKALLGSMRHDLWPWVREHLRELLGILAALFIFGVLLFFLVVSAARGERPTSRHGAPTSTSSLVDAPTGSTETGTGGVATTTPDPTSATTTPTGSPQPTATGPPSTATVSPTPTTAPTGPASLVGTITVTNPSATQTFSGEVSIVGGNQGQWRCGNAGNSTSTWYIAPLPPGGTTAIRCEIDQADYQAPLPQSLPAHTFNQALYNRDGIPELQYDNPESFTPGTAGH